MSFSFEMKSANRTESVWSDCWSQNMKEERWIREIKERLTTLTCHLWAPFEGVKFCSHFLSKIWEEYGIKKKQTWLEKIRINVKSQQLRSLEVSWSCYSLERMTRSNLRIFSPVSWTLETFLFDMNPSTSDKDLLYRMEQRISFHSTH